LKAHIILKFSSDLNLAFATLQVSKLQNQLTETSLELVREKQLHKEDEILLQGYMKKGKLLKLVGRAVSRELEQFHLKMQTSTLMQERRIRAVDILTQGEHAGSKEKVVFTTKVPLPPIKREIPTAHASSGFTNESMLLVSGSAAKAILHFQERVKAQQDRHLPDPSAGAGVFLGGSCNPTTWRHDVAIPLMEAANVKYYNPQVDDWTPELVEIEAKAKDQAAILLFVIDDQTRALASVAESIENICSGRHVVLVVREVQEGTCLAGDVAVSAGELKDLNRSRAYLEDIANRHGVNVFKDAAVAVKHICACQRRFYVRTEARRKISVAMNGIRATMAAPETSSRANKVTPHTQTAGDGER
jgi:hypothetical protein